jgi:hypothetical protein
MNSQKISYRLFAVALRLLLIIGIVGAGWVVYKKLPNSGPGTTTISAGQTTLVILLQAPSDMGKIPRDIPVEISPVDIVAVRHEFFIEPRAGQRFDEFLHQRMAGRELINARLDDQGRASVNVPQGNWWIHAILSGDEDLEWRLPILTAGGRQTIELTPQNAYTRSKSF